MINKASQGATKPTAAPFPAERRTIALLPQGWVILQMAIPGFVWLLVLHCPVNRALSIQGKTTANPREGKEELGFF